MGVTDRSAVWGGRTVFGGFLKGIGAPICGREAKSTVVCRLRNCCQGTRSRGRPWWAQALENVISVQNRKPWLLVRTPGSWEVLVPAPPHAPPPPSFDLESGHQGFIFEMLTSYTTWVP